jgi:cytochrome c-type biogenesis protein CcmH/NrfG
MKASLLIAVFVLGASACSRNNIEAVNLANEADKIRESNPDEAISKYEQARQLDPSNHRIAWKLTRVYRKKENWEKVNETLGPATKLAPDHADFFEMKGYALEQMAANPKGTGNWKEAQEPLETAIKLDPNFADPHFDLANVLYHLDDEKGALEHYTKAIELKPDMLAAYGELADLYWRLGFWDQAEQVAKEGVSWDTKGDKTGFNVHELYGFLLEHKGDWAGATKEYEAAKKACGACNEKGENLIFLNLGAAYAHSGRKSEASANILSFQKTICKGGAALRYADECLQAAEILKSVSGTQAP